jgi:hypothetical protein
VIVAVVAVRVVQAAVDQVIDVVAVRHLLVAAILVLARTADRRTDGGVGAAHFHDVLVVMVAVRVVQVAIVQVIDVAIVVDARVTAVFIVNMLVVGMDFMGHESLLSSSIIDSPAGKNRAQGKPVGPLAGGSVPRTDYEVRRNAWGN